MSRRFTLSALLSWFRRARLNREAQQQLETMAQGLIILGRLTESVWRSALWTIEKHPPRSIERSRNIARVGFALSAMVAQEMAKQAARTTAGLVN